jgi:hypothetical protein
MLRELRNIGASVRAWLVDRARADPFRPTRDLDLRGYGDNGVEAIAETLRAICAQPVPDDGVIFDVAALVAAPIREEVEYGEC